MSREELKEGKSKEALSIEASKPPYSTTTAGQLYVIHQVMNPAPDRYMEFTNMQGGMVFPMVIGMMKERAADPTRDRIKEPLSAISRMAYCQCMRGVGFKMAMLAGNVGLGMKAEESSNEFMPRQQTRL
jgi:hypothetical protein